ncbi:hypothetical protein COW36_07425 [bacterium (Candidatus Blackallbacteria) CG17_big_fil_post_rev_8_21_14_2_50_48_46]|uniref:RND efflux pump membrane fusion protein barrel-sandwich domain-containing protein n=1 Tax=bacterium (Candidatus Blackallbacteria) CG17_big_fil_post_rev_8_21_14_2_50_48_46 TaxID=2014261 RepID=A0A2M7G7Q2_9BACT|nr:MAG: hypothetical protein COW64_16525 [bacterium (Candidatus Blackallbacteria) CG18_big_fil_WC_8_21_14_2_50_49_26]PIW17766.1 MAG: hypothetical protein COW36_07425 [bacterium (Candidatus Blackallbacteria) CG17_big_fil_post_rev_8_21_14_2_50_48_46]PIW47325.1 MAG: hypothetical protein COW20_12950 [bacterium (Candidatus Blackallbacteria) CG13_big_fil_rev_8_21_14_2_50_49_14]
MKFASKIPGLLFLLGVIGLTGWGVAHFRKAGQSNLIESLAMDMNAMKPEPGAVPVATQAVLLKTISSEMSFTGSLQAENEIMIASRVDGTLSSVSVYNGSRVSKGQLLAQISAPELQARTEITRRSQNQAQQELRLMQAESVRLKAEAESSEAEIASAQAEVKSAQADWGVWQERLPREKALYEAGAIALEELQRYQADARSAEQAFKSAQARLLGSRRNSQARRALLNENRIRQGISQSGVSKSQAEVRENQIIQSFTEIRAPFSGLISERLMAPGSVIPAGTPLLKLLAIDPIRVQIPVPEQEAHRFPRGTLLTFSTGAAPDDEIEARISSVTPQVKAGTRTQLLEALLPNPDGQLLPGQYVKARLQVPGDSLPHPTVPVQALHQLKGQDYVWVMRAKRAHHQAVEVLAQNAEEVSLEDLPTEDPVITEGYADLQEGMAVVPVQWGAEGPERLPEPGGEQRLAASNQWHLSLKQPENQVLEINLFPKPPQNDHVKLEFKWLQAGQTQDSVKLSLETSMPAMNMAGPALTAKNLGQGKYSAEFNGMSGLWRVRLQVETQGKRLKPISFEFNLP